MFTRSAKPTPANRGFSVWPLIRLPVSLYGGLSSTSQSLARPGVIRPQVLRPAGRARYPAFLLNVNTLPIGRWQGQGCAIA